MKRAYLIPASLMFGSLAYAQTAPPVPNVQTGGVKPAVVAPAPPPDTRAITQADTGSSIDKPASVSPEPETGYHAPVIGAHKQIEPPPHSRVRAAAQKNCTRIKRTNCRPTGQR